MKLSGFSMVRNATKLYYPIRPAIESILPIVDEFIVALGDCDPDDRTRDEIQSIGSPKVRILDTIWDIETYPRGMENAHQTDIAKQACTGDWLFYLQADEVVHERDLDHIIENLEKHQRDRRVDGFLFRYRHFWGDYNHYQISHGWYDREIRIIRNDPEIHSYQSAQSFRRIPNFDGRNYRVSEGTYKLRVIELDAYIYHYGWVRPPHLMRKKGKALDTIHHGQAATERRYDQLSEEFDYGPLGLLGIFDGTHPAVMSDWIGKMDWSDTLDIDGKTGPVIHKHQRWKYRFLTRLERTFFGGRQIGAFRNYILIGKEKRTYKK